MTKLIARPRSHLDDTGSAHDDLRSPLVGIALCLSGGEDRAMLFHLGALWRLNELGFLPKLARISSVSGGSITAGVLGFNPVNQSFLNHAVEPLQAMRKHVVNGAAAGAFPYPASAVG